MATILEADGIRTYHLVLTKFRSPSLAYSLQSEFESDQTDRIIT